MGIIPRSIDKDYLFVDGGYLRALLLRWGQKLGLGNVPLPMDCSNLSKRFGRTLYYDAEPRPGDENDEFAEEESPSAEPEDRNKKFGKRLAAYADLKKRLSAIHDLKFREGKMYESRRKQSQVDVMLSVDALSHAMRGNVHHATFLAGDGDFVPVVNALYDAGVRITVWANRTSRSNELWDAADRRKEFSFMDTFSSCPPEFRDQFGVRSSEILSFDVIQDCFEQVAEGPEQKIGIYRNENSTIMVHRLPSAKNPMIDGVTSINDRSDKTFRFLLTYANEDRALELKKIPPRRNRRNN